MTVDGTGTIGSKYLNRDYPAVDGLEAGTTRQDYPLELEEEGI